MTAERLRGGLHALVCVCAAFALSAAGFGALQWREAAVTASNDADLLTTHLAQQIDLVGESQGQLRHVLLDARLSLDNVNKAAIAERLYLTNALPGTMGRVDGVLDQSRRSVAGMQGVEASAAQTLEVATTQLQGMSKVQEQMVATLSASTVLLQHADAVVSDPSVRQAEIDAARAAAATAGTAVDVQQRVHGIVHPAWPHRMAHAVRRLF